MFLSFLFNVAGTLRKSEHENGIDFEAASKLILDSQWLRNVYPLLGSNV